MSMQQFCLRWNNHQTNFISVFSNLLHNETLVDVTLAAEGHHLQAHKVVLSACSSYFQSLFTVNPCQHPIVILKDIKYSDLKIMVDFMYYGEVNVSQEQLPSIIKTAESLKIKGLAEMHSGSFSKWPSDSRERGESCSPSSPQTPSYRGRKRMRKSSTGSNSGSGDKADEISEITLVATNTIKPEPAIASQETGEGVRRPVNTNTESQGSIEEDQISIMSNMESNSAATPVQSETPIQDLNQQASNMSQSSTISQSQAHQARQVQNANSKDGQVPTVSSFTSLNPTPSTSATVQPSSVSATDAETLAGMFPFFNCDNAEGLQTMQTGSGEPLNAFDTSLHVKQEIDDSIEMDTNQTEENLSQILSAISMLECRIMNRLDDLIRSFTNPSPMDTVSTKSTLAVDLPLKTVDAFLKFDEAIVNDPNKRNALKSLMNSFCRHAGSVKEGIAKILSNIIAKEIQLQYSACGRSLKGQGKRNLSKTAVYYCMQDELLNHFTDSDPAEIISKTSRWLAGACDRDGGKKERTRPKFESMQ